MVKEQLQTGPEGNWIDAIRKINENKAKLILYGLSLTGEEIAQLLIEKGLDFYAFCGRNPQNHSNVILGKPVYPVEWLFEHPDECYVIIAAHQPGYAEIEENLRRRHFPEEKILHLFQLRESRPNSDIADWKYVTASAEQIYHTADGHELKYLYKDNGSASLCISFSSFHSASKPPLYSLRQLWNTRTDFNLLYILDDMVNIPGGGSYYLGSNHSWWGLSAVSELIYDIISRTKPSTTVAAGYSKGGTAALMFGILAELDYVVIGDLQYRIGAYMRHYDRYRRCLEGLLGKEHVTDRGIDKLNLVVPEIIARHQGRKKPAVYIQYFDHYSLFPEQCFLLLQDLRQHGYDCKAESCRNLLHTDVSFTFPAFLRKSLDEIVSS